MQEPWAKRFAILAHPGNIVLQTQPSAAQLAQPALIVLQIPINAKRARLASHHLREVKTVILAQPESMPALVHLHVRIANPGNMLKHLILKPAISALQVRTVLNLAGLLALSVSLGNTKTLLPKTHAKPVSAALLPICLEVPCVQIVYLVRSQPRTRLANVKIALQVSTLVKPLMYVQFALQEPLASLLLRTVQSAMLDT